MSACARHDIIGVRVRRQFFALEELDLAATAKAHRGVSSNMRIACGNSVRNLSLVIALSATMSGADAQPAAAPNPDAQNVTMTMFKIITRKDHKFLETQTGETLPIEGKNIDKNAQMLAVYRDANANYWFINKHGEPTSIPPSKVQWAINDISEQRYAKEHAYPPVGGPNTSTTYQQGVGYPAPVQQTTIVNQPGSSGGGAMVGGLIGDSMYGGNHYYGVPYGAPLYHEGNRGYYNNNGNKTYINNAHTDPVMKQWNQQGNWADHDHWNNTGGEKLKSEPHRSFHEGWGGFRGRR